MWHTRTTITCVTLHPSQKNEVAFVIATGLSSACCLPLSGGAVLVECLSRVSVSVSFIGSKIHSGKYLIAIHIVLGFY